MVVLIDLALQHLLGNGRGYVDDLALDTLRRLFAFQLGLQLGAVYNALRAGRCLCQDLLGTVLSRIRCLGDDASCLSISALQLALPSRAILVCAALSIVSGA